MKRNQFKTKPAWVQGLTVLFLITFFSGCAMIAKDYTELYGPSSQQERILTADELKQNDHISFANEVQPILANRCAVCHSCNDAPCQLTFTSIEGIDRGASIEPVYNGSRFTQQNPSRLGVDASSTEQWREKGFFPVLNERTQNASINRHNSLLYKTLLLKRGHDYPEQGRLPEAYDIGTSLVEEESFIHGQVCPNIERYADFSSANPQLGMPFALPPLNSNEFATIKTWIEQGAKAEPVKPLSEQLTQQVEKWEVFFNGSTKKEQLMSRYIYEHIYLGHLYFKEFSKSDFFMLVRSKTAPGQAIEIINTVRPYNDPGVDTFYYRLQRYTRVIVDKTHMPYSLSDDRMKRYKELFIDAEYNVGSLPSYAPEISSNPFKAFAEIPAKNRYKFLLDEARYFVNGFIKGPVCRGSIALSVIDDHFWVAFMDPDKSYISQDSDFLAKVSDNLRMPSEKENNASLLSVWATYEDEVIEYFVKKVNYLENNLPQDAAFGINHIWNGDHINDNAALTVYRHYDSATVLKGFIGSIPKTGWIMDYPILERVHYLLVAGFDVYGKIGHQLSTRLYMNYLRFEAELEFLTFLPLEEREKIHRHWYRNSSETDALIDEFEDLYARMRETRIKYKTDDVKKEFFVKLSNHMQNAQVSKVDYFNRCADFPEVCNSAGWDKHVNPVTKPLIALSSIKGERAGVFPNLTFMRIKVDGSVENDHVFSIIRNNAYLNVASLSGADDEDNRVRSEDTVDIVPGFVGSYPNFFIEVDQHDVAQFIEQYKAVDSFEKYHALVDQYGIRRTSPDFWKISDWFYKKHQHDNIVSAGLFDLNRYKNR